MKIPNSNLYCQFHYKDYIKTSQLEAVNIKLQNETKQIFVRTKERATSIDEVPYWRIYIVRTVTLDEPDEYGRKTRREIVHKTIGNYPIDDVFKLLRSWGDPSNGYTIIKCYKYHYEAWPRKTASNRRT